MQGQMTAALWLTAALVLLPASSRAQATWIEMETATSSPRAMIPVSSPPVIMASSGSEVMAREDGNWSAKVGRRLPACRCHTASPSPTWIAIGLRRSSPSRVE